MKFLTILKITLSLFFLLSSILVAEELTFLCSNFPPDDTVSSRNQLLIDSLLHTQNNFFHITPFPSYDQTNQEVCFFNPGIFKADSITFQQKVLASNIQTEDSLFYNLIPYKPVLLDSQSVIFISITTPDFPVLYKKYSADIVLKPDIFKQTKILCGIFKYFGFDYIIAINYLGDFLSRELLMRVPELDLVIDYFSLDNTHHYMQEITHPRLINWDRRKEHFLFIDIALEKEGLSIKEVVEIK